MPEKVPLDRCERIRGINVYRPSELVSRKLHTIVGERPREKARDIYDAAWIVTKHPELVAKTDGARLRDWLTTMKPETRDELQSRLQGEQLTSRVSTTEIWKALESGIWSLDRGPEDPGEGGGARNRAQSTNKRAPAPATPPPQAARSAERRDAVTRRTTGQSR